MDANTIKKLREIYDEKMRLIELRSNLEKRVEELKNDPTVIEYFKVLSDLDENKRKCDDGLIRDEYDVCCYLSKQDSILSGQSSKIFFRGPAVKIEFEKGYKDNDLHPYETAVDELEKKPDFIRYYDLVDDYNLQDVPFLIHRLFEKRNNIIYPRRKIEYNSKWTDPDCFETELEVVRSLYFKYLIETKNEEKAVKRLLLNYK